MALKKFFLKNTIEAGCDEAGRGCLAGPVFAAAVILPANFRNTLLNDSKQLTAEERNKLRPIIESKALAWAVAMVDNVEIDVINILNASILAMHKSLDQLKITPQHIIVDGNRFKPYKETPHTCVVDGDEKYMSIAAASVLAKTYRDDFMQKLHEEHSQYAWFNNKGYGTLQHRKAIEEHGVTIYHRQSFRLFYNDEQVIVEE